ncbi:alpha/beta hydrolase-fold protein [Embleya sp. AB8]|uniref:alpha/beta hydrolase n=1 Tax=Embleya sp. AB8 TaxID=3156304 RepID=UPI003C741B87
MTRTLKGLLIAVTLGAVVVLVLRARESRAAAKAEPGPRPAELPSMEPPVEVRVEPPVEPRAAERPVKRPAARPAAPVSVPTPEPSGPAAESKPAPVLRAAVSVPVVPVVAVPGRPDPAVDPAPARRRRGVRSPVGVGVLAVAVVAAGVGGTFAYQGISGDHAQNVAATKVAPPVEPVVTSGQPKAAPQKFTKVAAKSGGTLTRMNLAGRQSGVTADVWVWLPPGYDTPANQGRNYPVLVTHSSLPGVGTNSFVDDSVSFLPKLAGAIEAGTVPPYIVVAPVLMPYSKQEADADQSAAKDTECSDIPNKPKMATFHNDDVREAVLATYRASADRASWALIGDGSGGLCAVKYALQYPQYYAAAVGLSGRTTLKSPLWGTDSAARAANDPVKLLDARPDVQILLSGQTGGTEFAAKAKAPTMVKAITGAGGTSTDTARLLPEAFTFLGRNTRNPAA